MSDWETIGDDGWENVGWEDVTTKDKSYWERVGGLSGIGESVLGAGVGLADYITGIPGFVAGTALGVGGTLSGEDPKIARKAAHKAAADTFPPLSEILKKFGIDYTDTAGHKAMMAPLESITNLIESGGEKAGELVGNKDFGEGSKIAAELGMLALGGKVAKDTVPQNFDGAWKGNKTRIEKPVKDATIEELQAKIPTNQMEMLAEDTRNNKYGAATNEIDSNGMPFNRALSEDVQMAQRVPEPDLFGKENLDNLKKQDDIEAAYAARDMEQKAEAAEVQKSLEYPPDSYLPGQGSVERESPHRPANNGIDYKLGESEIEANKNAVGVRIEAQDAISNNDFKGAMDAVSKLKDDATASPLLQFLGNLADAIRANPKIAPEVSLGKETGIGGSFNNATGKMTWNSGHMYDLMHEAVHASVNKALILFRSGKQHMLSTGQKIAAKHINDLYKNVKAREQEIIDIYTGAGWPVEKAVNQVKNMLSNEREFVAYSSTEPVMRKFLSETKYEGSRTFSSKLSDAWSRIIGLKPKFSSEFDRFMWGTETLIKESDGGFTKVPENTVAVDYARKADAISQIPGLEMKGQSYKFNAYDWKNREKALDVIKRSPDLKKEPSFYAKSLSARGYLSAELLDNQAYHAGVSVIKGVLDHFSRRSETQLFAKDGVYSEMTKGEKILSPGDMSELTRQLVAAKGDANYQFKLNPSLEKIKDHIRSIMDESWKEVLATVGPEKAKKLPQKVDNYFPGIFEGPWIFEVRDTPKSKPMLWSSNNKWVANARAAKLKSDGYTVGVVRKRPHIESLEFGRDNMVAEYQLMIESMMDTETTNLRNRINASISYDAMTESGFSKHLKKWNGYKGTLGDNPFFSATRNYYNAKEAIKRYIEAHNQWMASQELAKFYKELGKLNTSAPIARDYMQKYVSDVLGRGEGEAFVTHLMEGVESVIGQSPQSLKKAVRWAANISTTQMLGASFRAASQNFFQTFESVVPKLLQLTKNPVDITSSLMVGYNGFIQVLLKHQVGEMATAMENILRVENKIPDSIMGTSINEMYKYALDKGILDITLLESSPPFTRKLPNALYKYAGGFLTRASEQAARFGTFSAITDHLVHTGVPKEQAFEIARQITEGHMVDYSSNSRAAILANTGVIGESLGRLQSYKVNQLSRYANYINYLKRSGDGTPLAAMLTTNLLLAGVQGMIGFDVISSVMNQVAKASDDPEQKKFNLLSWVAENSPEWVTWGALSSVTGLGFFNAFSQPLIGEGDFSNIAPVLSNQVEQGRNIAKLLTENPEGVPNFEMGRRLSSIAPQMVQQQIQSKYLTENGKSVSKYTGEPTYEYKKGDRWVSNVMPFGRAKNAALVAQKRSEETIFNEGKSDKLNKIGQLARDIGVYGNGTVLKINKLKQLQKEAILGYHGDPEQLTTMLEKIYQEASLPNPIYKDLMGEVTYSNIDKKQRALKYKKLQEKE